jgi:hypothetical protein
VDVLVNSIKRWQCCKDSFRTIDYQNPLQNLGVLHWKWIIEFQCIYSPTCITHLRGPARFSSTEYVRQVFISRVMHILYFHNILRGCRSIFSMVSLWYRVLYKWFTLIKENVNFCAKSSKTWQCWEHLFRTIDYRKPPPNLGVLH